MNEKPRACSELHSSSSCRWTTHVSSTAAVSAQNRTGAVSAHHMRMFKAVSAHHLQFRLLCVHAIDLNTLSFFLTARALAVCCRKYADDIFRRNGRTLMLDSLKIYVWRSPVWHEWIRLGTCDTDFRRSICRGNNTMLIFLDISLFSR